MATRNKKRIIVPKGGNAAELTKMFRDALASRKKIEEERHNKFVRSCELKSEMLRAMAKAQGYKRAPQTAEKIAKRKELYEKFRKAVSKTRAKRPRGHNPLRFPPYDGAGSVNGGSGIVEWNPYGSPSASDGATGGDLGVWQSSRGSSGSGYAATDIGFSYYAQTSGTLFVTGYFELVGCSAYLYAPAPFIQASGYAAVVVQINGPSGILVNSPIWVYEKSVVNAPDYSYMSGYYFPMASAPVRAGNWYTILAGTVQDAYADPDCDADVDMAYAFVNFVGYYQE